MRATWRPTLPRAPSEDAALSRAISWLKEHSSRAEGSFRVSLSQLLQAEILAANAVERETQRDENGNYAPTEVQFHVNTEPYFVAAATLVSRGILAPLPTSQPNMPLQPHCDEYLVTGRGKRWLDETQHDPVLPAELMRFSKALRERAPRLGQVYLDRGLEALKCYHSNCFYASCVMAGASGEAILLELAAAKTGDRASAEAQLRGAKSRQRLVDTIKAQKNGQEQRILDQFVELSAFYRDDAAHGAGSPIDEEAAHLALMTLFRLARFADDRWATLTT
jgi:hypothetical protein